MKIAEIQEMFRIIASSKVSNYQSRLLGKEHFKISSESGLPGDHRLYLYLMNRFPLTISVLLNPFLSLAESISKLSFSEENRDSHLSDPFFGPDPEKWDITIKIDSYINRLGGNNSKIRQGDTLMSAYLILKEYHFIGYSRELLINNKEKFQKLDSLMIFHDKIKNIHNNDISDFEKCFHQYLLIYNEFQIIEGKLLVMNLMSF